MSKTDSWQAVKTRAKDVGQVQIRHCRETAILHVFLIAHNPLMKQSQKTSLRPLLNQTSNKMKENHNFDGFSSLVDLNPFRIGSEESKDFTAHAQLTSGLANKTMRPAFHLPRKQM